MPDTVVIQSEISNVRSSSFPQICMNEEEFKPERKSSLLSTIRYLSDPIVECAFGEMGKHMSSFARHVDLDHPDIQNIGGGILVDGHPYAECAKEVLSLATHALRSDLNHASGFLRRILTETPGHEVATLHICDPTLGNFASSRLLIDKEARRKIRLRRKNQEFFLAEFYNQKSDSWLFQPNSFLDFIRNATPFAGEIENSKRRANIYHERGLESQRKRLLDKIAILESQSKERYFGFNRMPMRNAALILARVHGFDLVKHQGGPRLAASKDLVQRFENELPGSTERSGVFFQPRIYPVHSFIDIAPSEDVKKIIETVDEFPIIGGRQLFDHLAVLVPSLSKSVIYDTAVDSCEVKDDVIVFDRMIVQKNLVVPILLGMREERSYFIDYWK